MSQLHFQIYLILCNISFRLIYSDLFYRENLPVNQSILLYLPLATHELNSRKITEFDLHKGITYGTIQRTV